MEYGVNQARRAGLESHDVANSRRFTEFSKSLKR